jgi:serine/alanine adding enzyme
MTEYLLQTSETITKPAWEAYIREHEHATVFHSAFLFEAFGRTHDFLPFSLFAVDSDNQIKAMLSGLKQTVKPGLLTSLSTRIVLMKPPLYSDVEALEFLLNEYLKYVQNKAIYTEIRNDRVDENVRHIYTGLGFRFQEHLNYTVDCSDNAKAWQALSESKRRQLKKVLAAGLVIVDNPSTEQMEQFYSILHDLYQYKVRKPLPSLKFFRELLEASKAFPALFKFLLIEHQDSIIGGICCPISGKKAIHELYIAGLDEQYKELYPSSVATWAAIDFAAKNGITVFDFMGAGSPDEGYGVREFKSRFGGTLSAPGRYMYIHSPLKMKVAEAGFNLLRKKKAGL